MYTDDSIATTLTGSLFILFFFFFIIYHLSKISDSLVGEVSQFWKSSNNAVTGKKMFNSLCKATYSQGRISWRVHEDHRYFHVSMNGCRRRPYYSYYRKKQEQKTISLE